METKILIVDDEPSVIKMVDMLLESFGYLSYFIPKADYLVKTLEADSFDLILMDINMPGIDGITALINLKQTQYKEIPVIMLTADMSEETLENCFNSGAADYITKPIQELVLKSRIKAVIEKQQAEQEIKEREEKFRTLAENIPAVIFRFNLDYKIIYTNNLIEKYFEIPPDKYIGKKIEDFEIQQKIIDLINNAFGIAITTESIQTIEFSFSLSDKIHYLQAKIIPEKNLAGKILSILCLLNDISDIKAKENVLTELNSTKDKFFSIIAHDLRNPFSAILGFSEMLLTNIEKFSNDKIKQYIIHINDAANHTYKLLENLLEWAKLQRGLIIPVIELNNLHSLASDICMLSQDIAISKEITIQNNIQSDISVNCDAQMTMTVFRNLISNAIKFTKSGGLISICAIQKDTFVEIKIQDTGIGIPSDKIPKLFKVEQNISTNGTNDEHGSGLGLILCKELIEKQGGKIWVDSVENIGTSFCFTIPC